MNWQKHAHLHRISRVGSPSLVNGRWARTWRCSCGREFADESAYETIYICPVCPVIRAMHDEEKRG